MPTWITEFLTVVGQLLSGAFGGLFGGAISFVSRTSDPARLICPVRFRAVPSWSIHQSI